MFKNKKTQRFANQKSSDNSNSDIMWDEFDYIKSSNNCEK